MAIEIKLPALGDGVDSGDVLEVLVQPGDLIELEQGIVEIETDKATVEVPSSHAGTVQDVLVHEGDSILVGQTLITLEATAGPSGAEVESSPSESTTAESSTPAGAQEAATSREKATPEAPAPPPSAPESPLPSTASAPAPPPTAAPIDAPPVATGTVPAGPSVRRFAREVGVDLNRVAGSGPGGRITREDVLDAVRRANAAVRSGIAGVPSTDASAGDAWGNVHTERLTKIRKTIAAQMHQSWSTVPRVTNFDDADVADLERIRQSSKEDYAAKGIKLTSMPFVIKSVAMALREHPLVNASLDLDNQQIIYKEYVNIGIAVDTERGLVVPVLRNADQLSIPDIARQLAGIADNVRNGSFKIEDLRGGTFTISNLGAIGGSYSTPIVNVPEVAILLVGRSRKMPVVMNDDIAARLMMPLSLSYDHRLVDGAAAARFLNDVIGYLEAPSRLLLAP